MKTFSTILLALIPAVFIMTSACASMPGNGGEPYQVQEFSIREPGKLNVKTSGGSIKVEKHNSQVVVVEMYVRHRNKNLGPDDASAREVLENYNIDISQSTNTISAIAEKSGSSGSWFGNNNNNTSISFTVYVPENMSCNLKTSGGSIALEGVKGTQDVKTSGGSLKLQDIEGNMQAHTSGGSIKINNYAGILNAHTSGGTIKLAEASGEMNLHTSGGSINIDNVNGSIDARTSGGSINANLLSLKNQLKLKTSGGSISAVIPEGLGLDLDLKGNRVNTRLSNFNGEAEKNRIKGTMNGGGILVELATSGGSVNLDYR